MTASSTARSRSGPCLAALLILACGCSSTSPPGDVESATSAAPAAPRVVLLEPGVKNAYPHWSPDGARILFQSNRGGRWQLETMRADGSDRRPFAPSVANDNFPDWSPDGTRVAFVSDRDGNEDVCVMQADGSGLRNLTRHAARDIHPYWSPDGASILFASTRDVGRFQLWEVAAAGGEARRLVASDDDDTCARVSPGGDRIVYLTNLPDRDDVVVRRRDGSAPFNVTDDARADGWPCWMPDGERLLACARVGGDFALHVLSADGRERRQLTFPEAGSSDTRPNVSPDGRRVVFNRDRGDTSAILVLEVRGGRGSRKS